MIETWKLEKHSSDTYVMRWCGKPRNGWWAVIFVNSEYGCLSIQSDFGDYSYRWTSPGEEFKKFLVDINDDYLIDKLSYGCKNTFYRDESIEALQTYVDELKAQYPERAEELDCDLADIKDDISSVDAAYFLVAKTVIGELMSDDCRYSDFIKTGPSYQLLAFVKNIWPGFISILKAEVNNA